ncbi:MAG: helix-turn-helix domain-containing protein [Bacilli bacterium]|nr:helix-turn-helix domain-containing protein [Bacilli bacterium]
MNISRLREVREDRSISQSTIAKLLHTTQQQYSKYELGIRIIPIEKLVILARFYNTSIDYLISLTDVRAPYPLSIMDSDSKIHSKQ